MPFVELLYRDERFRRNDLNSSEWVQHEKVRVPCDNVCCRTAHGERKELVISRIATRRDFHIDINPHSFSRECCEETAYVLLIDVTAEFVASKNFE